MDGDDGDCHEDGSDRESQAKGEERMVKGATEKAVIVWMKKAMSAVMFGL